MPTLNDKGAIQIAPELHVGGQLRQSDLPELVRRGIRTIISLRPDDENDVTMPADAAAHLAATHGMSFKHLPIAMSDATDEDIINQFENVLDQVEGPVFVYCKSGTRAAIAWALSAVRRQPIDCVLAATQRAGFDLSMLIDEMREQAARHSDSKVAGAKFECSPLLSDRMAASLPA